jgi:hypothetical protein
MATITRDDEVIERLKALLAERHPLLAARGLREVSLVGSRAHGRPAPRTTSTCSLIRPGCDLRALRSRDLRGGAQDQTRHPCRRRLQEPPSPLHRRADDPGQGAPPVSDPARIRLALEHMADPIPVSAGRACRR